jgi:eukaryotic-like serine/threonine-protein kinase
MRRSSLAELARAAAETDPVRPSDAVRRKTRDAEANAETTLVAVAAARSTDPSRLQRRLRGELDAIVQMAMALEPDRRYASAEAFARDLGAYRAGEPIAARPATLAYRTRRFVARNAIAVSAAAVLLVMTSGFSVLYTVRITRERNRAQQESERATQVASFLQDLFAGADPTDASGRATTAVDLLDRGLGRIDAELAGQPDVSAELLELLADIYIELGLFDRSERAARSAVALRRSIAQSEAPGPAAAERTLASTLFNMGRDREALALIDTSLAKERMRADVNVRGLATSLALKSAIARRLGDLRTAEAAFDEAFALRRTLSADTSAMLTARNNYGHLLIATGRYAEAEQLYREVYGQRVRTLGKEQTQTQTTMTNLVRALNETGKFEEAEDLGWEVVELRKRALGPKHVRVGTALRNLGVALLGRGAYDRAITTLEESLEVLVGSLGEDHIDNAEVLTALGLALTATGRTDSARVVLERVLAMHAARQENGHPGYAAALIALGENELVLGDTTEVERVLRGAERILRQALGNDHPELAKGLHALGRALAPRDPAAAEKTLDEAYRIRRVSLGAEHPLTRSTQEMLGALRPQ